ncbi:hypothetical protein [Rhizobium sp. BK176]|uniref:hypothetical protein n=1 Tax=Rhizobium sp. BK176 TaxID=2587071 RepID=UPI0021687B7B|nr:hypothetical protein [Rhizobium sp. BK176]MCS4088465.1 hypothetical protein [Rhizobium sp. BK176]
MTDAAKPDTVATAPEGQSLQWEARIKYPAGFTAKTDLGTYSVAGDNGTWTAFRNGYESTIESNLATVGDAKSAAELDYRRSKAAMSELNIAVPPKADNFYSQQQVDELAKDGRLVPTEGKTPSYLASALNVIVLYKTGRWVMGKVGEHQWDRITHYHVPVEAASSSSDPDETKRDAKHVTVEVLDSDAFNSAWAAIEDLTKEQLVEAYRSILLSQQALVRSHQSLEAMIKEKEERLMAALYPAAPAQ